MSNDDQDHAWGIPRDNDNDVAVPTHVEDRPTPSAGAAVRDDIGARACKLADALVSALRSDREAAGIAADFLSAWAYEAVLTDKRMNEARKSLTELLRRQTGQAPALGPEIVSQRIVFDKDPLRADAVISSGKHDALRVNGMLIASDPPGPVYIAHCHVRGVGIVMDGNCTPISAFASPREVTPFMLSSRDGLELAVALTRPGGVTTWQEVVVTLFGTPVVSGLAARRRPLTPR